eukprot:6194964-Pleurochrysis_carterae.AAC.1
MAETGEQADEIQTWRLRPRRVCARSVGSRQLTLAGSPNAAPECGTIRIAIIGFWQSAQGTS